MTEANEPPALVAPVWEPPAMPGSAIPPIAEPPTRPPGMIEIISGGIDLNVGLTREIRRMSLFVGGLFLAALGPIAAIVIVRSVQLGGFDWLVNSLTAPLGLGGITFPGTERAGLGPWAAIAAFIGGTCLVAISVDVQLMATALLGGRLSGHTLDLRQTVGLARQGFWRLIFASITVGLILIIPRQVLGSLLIRGAEESRLALSTALDVLLSTPFAYVGAAVILARATPFAAVRQSWGMARRRWRLAFVIGIVNTAVSYLATFAIGVGLDILFRIATGLGIDRGLGPLQSVELVAIVAFAIVAIGSLTLTVAALSTAPQVIAWLGLGGPASGFVDPARDNPFRPPASTRLVSLPMQIALMAATAAAVIWIITRA
jgi:hypothetical protein